MPLSRRLPKRGFKNIFRKHYRAVNLGRLQVAIDAGKLDAAQPITEQAMRAAGLVKNLGDGIRILANGNLKANINIEATGASKAAVAAIEKAGGSISLSKPSRAVSEPEGPPGD